MLDLANLCDCCGDAAPIKHEAVEPNLEADILCKECLEVYIEEEELEKAAQIAGAEADLFDVRSYDMGTHED